jgi:transposase
MTVTNQVRPPDDERTRAYASRRTQEGLSKPEIIRCLKRYIARDVFKLLQRRPILASATLTSKAA